MKSELKKVLVGGWATPLKNMKVNWDDDIPNIWENKKWQPNHQPESIRSARSSPATKTSKTSKTHIAYRWWKNKQEKYAMFPRQRLDVLNFLQLATYKMVRSELFRFWWEASDSLDPKLGSWSPWQPCNQGRSGASSVISPQLTLLTLANIQTKKLLIGQRFLHLQKLVLPLSCSKQSISCIAPRGQSMKVDLAISMMGHGPQPLLKARNQGLQHLTTKSNEESNQKWHYNL